MWPSRTCNESLCSLGRQLSSERLSKRGTQSSAADKAGSAARAPTKVRRVKCIGLSILRGAERPKEYAPYHTVTGSDGDRWGQGWFGPKSSCLLRSGGGRAE